MIIFPKSEKLTDAQRRSLCDLAQAVGMLHEALERGEWNKLGLESTVSLLIARAKLTTQSLGLDRAAMAKRYQHHLAEDLL
jgi:hypothetical protein